MASKIIEVADAIVAALAGDTFSQTLTCRRRYIPRIDVKDATSFFVTVVPKAIRTEQGHRAGVFKEFDIDVAIQKRLTADADPEKESGIEECDELMLLAEQVLDFFVPGAMYASCPLLPTPDAPLVYHPEHLQNDKVFTAVFTLTLKQF